MSPKHDSEVRRTVRTQTTYSIPSRHRVGMCEAAVDSSSWLAVDRWAVTRKLVMDYPSVLGNVKQVQRYYYYTHSTAVRWGRSVRDSHTCPMPHALCAGSDQGVSQGDACSHLPVWRR